MVRVPNFTSQDMGGANLFQAPTVTQVPNFAPEQIMQYGQGMEAFGAGMQRMNQELQRQQMRLQDMQDEAAAKSLEDEAWQFAQNLTQNKDTGYLYTQGAAAVDGYQPTADALQKKFEEIGQRAKTPMQQQLISGALQKLQMHFGGELERHAGREMRQNAKTQATARLNRFAEMAAQNWRGWETEDNPVMGPDMYRDSRRAMVSELAALANLEGIPTDSDAFQSMVKERMTSLHEKTVANIVQAGDPAQAQRYASKFLDAGEIDAKVYTAARPQIRAADDKANAQAFALSLWNERGGRSGNQLLTMIPNMVAQGQLRPEWADEVQRTIRDQQNNVDAVTKEQLAADVDTARIWFRQQREAGTQPDLSNFRQSHPDVASRIERNGGFAELEKIETDAKRPGGSFSPQAIAALERMKSDGKLADQDPSEFYTQWYSLLSTEQMNYWMQQVRDAKEARGKSDYKPKLDEHDRAWGKFLDARPKDKETWEAGLNASPYNTSARNAYGKLEMQRQAFWAEMDDRFREIDEKRAQSGKPTMTRKERDEVLANILEDKSLFDLDVGEDSIAAFDAIDQMMTLPEKDRLERMGQLAVQVNVEGGQAKVTLAELPPEIVQKKLIEMIGYQDYTSTQDMAQMWHDMGRPKTLEDIDRITQERIRSMTPKLSTTGMNMLRTASDVFGRIDELQVAMKSAEAGGTHLDAQSYIRNKQELEALRSEYDDVLQRTLPRVGPSDEDDYAEFQKLEARRVNATTTLRENAKQLTEQAFAAVQAANDIMSQTPDDQYLAPHQKAAVEKQRQDKAMELLAASSKAVHLKKELLETIESDAIQNVEALESMVSRVADRPQPSMDMPQGPAPLQNANDPAWRQMRGQQLRMGRTMAMRTTKKREAAVEARMQHDTLLHAAKDLSDLAYDYYGPERYAKDDFTDAERVHNVTLLKQVDAYLAKAKKLDAQYGKYWQAADDKAGAPDALKEYKAQVKLANYLRKSMGELYPHEKQGKMTPGETVHQLLNLRSADIHQKRANDLMQQYGRFFDTNK